MADSHSAQHHPTASPTSGSNSRHADSTSQVTACHRCRRQKLRCSKETPSCKRCQDISAVCTYPAPPDRKLLAAQRAQNAKARSLRDVGNPGEPREYSAPQASAVLDRRSPIENDPAQVLKTSTSETGRSPLERSPFHLAPSTALLQVPFPSKDLALALINAYFDHLYNSTLLFHKETLVQDYLAGRLSDCVALSIFALGANFLSETRGPNSEFSPSLPGSSRPGEDWARAASQQVLMNCDQPRYETIQACQIIALYWWAFSQTDRTNMHNHIAYRTCRLLGYHTPRLGKPGDDAFGLELKRRAFWCSWSMCCLSQNNAAFKAESWKEAIGLPFPCDEISFSAGQPLVKEAFDPEGHIEVLEDGTAEDGRTSYMAEIVKLLSLWWEIQRFAKRYVGAGPLDSLRRLSQLQELDQQLEHIHDSLSTDFQYINQSSFAKRDIRHSYQLFSVHALYHLCVCTLHSSIVPVFSNIPPDPRISKKLTRMSAEEAVKHSLKLCTMATEFLGIIQDKSRCPSFSAYAMFVAASIQFKSLGAQGLLRSDSIGRLYPAISILQRVKRIWRPLEGLWLTLDALFRGAGMDINRLSDERQLLPILEAKPNIDLIVAHGVMSGDTDIYTYVPNEAFNEESSTQSSASLSRRGSDTSQHASYRRTSSFSKSKAPATVSHPTNSGSVTMPIITRPDAPVIPWKAPSPQHPEMHPGEGMLQQHYVHSGAPPGFVPMNPVPENIQGSRLDLQTQMTAVDYPGIDVGMGIDNMDLDSANANLWWDRPFDAIPTDQYGVWFSPRYQDANAADYYRP